MKYIKEVKFSLIENKNQVYKLSFNKGVNVIIGPKGGGKSTLLNVIHAIHNGMQPEKRYRDTIKEFGFEIENITYSDGESKTFRNLNKYNKEFCFDLVKQDDNLKTKLDENKEIENDIENFIEEILFDKINCLAKLFQKYFYTFVKIKSIQNYRINWNLLSTSLLTDKFLTIELNELLKHNDDSNLNEQLKINRNLLVINKVYSDYIQYNIVDNELINAKKNLYIKIIEELKKIYEFHEKELRNIASKKAVGKSLNWIHKKFNDDLKNSEDIIKKSKAEQNRIKGFFQECSTELATNVAYFNFLTSGEINLVLKGSQLSEYEIELFIDKKLKLKNAVNEQNDSFSSLVFDKVLYTPSDKKTFWINWIKKSYFSNNNALKKNVNLDDLFNIIKDILVNECKTHIELRAEGKDYKKMSLGTKTSFGLKQKIKRFDSNIIFLDQPEDNLDNYTIYNDILKLLSGNKSNQKIEQIFLITHNGNLGALTNPATITTCKLTPNDFENSYIQNQTLNTKIQIDENILDSPVLHYLEGGQESLVEREKILINKKG